MKDYRNRASLIVVILLITFSAPACGSNTPANAPIPTGAVPHATQTAATPVHSVTPVDWSRNTGSVTPVIDIRSAEDLPVFPGAQRIVKHVVPPPNQPPETEFDTANTVEDVAAFYRVTLPRLGWITVQDIAPDNLSLEFAWSAGDSNTPYKLLVYVVVQRSKVHLTPVAGGPTHVIITPIRVPYAAKIPLYPGVRQSTVNEMPGEYHAMHRITTYLTTATPRELEQYYKATLAQYGWQNGLGAQGPGSIGAGLYFGYSSRGTNHFLFGSATIVAQDAGSGQTRVTIDASGLEISQQPSP